jgi:hypothetical protein
MHKAARDPDAERARAIALPGLANPESQLGVPLLVRGDLVGVLCLESEVPYRFHEEDKASIELLGSYLAIAIQHMQWEEREEGSGLEKSWQARPDPGGDPGGRVAAVAGHEIAYYAADECVLVDGDYLIRGLSAKILWRLLTIRDSTGRDEFTNRELRLDKSLHLPEWKDNLESRLLLLRRRLEQKCPDIRIVPRCRGRFALEVTSRVALRQV